MAWRTYMLELLLDGRPLVGVAELEEGQTAELACRPPEGAELELELGDAALEAFLRPGDPAWRWRWLAPGAAGAYPLRLRATWPDGGATELRASLQVLPRKLDADAYHLLLADLQRLGRGLVLALGGGGEDAALPAQPDGGPLTPVEELASLFGADLERLAGAVERLARRPPDRLRPALEQVEPGRARDLSALDRARLQAGGRTSEEEAREQSDSGAGEEELAGAALAALIGRLASIPERQPTPSYDSYEHRLLRRLLELLGRRVARLLDQPGLPQAARAQGEAARERLRGLRALAFLAGVPPLAEFRGPTPRLQRDPELRMVYRYWQRLRRRPLLSWEAATLALPVAELPRLYERWCAARAALALLALPGWQVTTQRIATLAGDGDDGEWRLALPEQAALLELVAADGVSLALRYQPRYPPAARGRGAALLALDRHTRVPDIAVELRRPGAPVRVIVLDAKYRLDAAGGVPADALADAYSYLGGIGGPDGRRATLAVALLFPGRGPAEIYPSGVAALPLIPGAPDALERWLGEALV